MRKVRDLLKGKISRELKEGVETAENKKLTAIDDSNGESN